MWIKDHLISAKRWIYIGSSRDFMPHAFSIRALTSAIAFLALAGILRLFINNYKVQSKWSRA